MAETSPSVYVLFFYVQYSCFCSDSSLQILIKEEHRQSQTIDDVSKLFESIKLREQELNSKVERLDSRRILIDHKVDELLDSVVKRLQPNLSDEEKEYHRELGRMHRLLETNYRPRLNKFVRRMELLTMDESLAQLSLSSSSPSRFTRISQFGSAQQLSIESLLKDETQRLDTLVELIRSLEREFDSRRPPIA
jgi:hypothetical protein